MYLHKSGKCDGRCIMGVIVAIIFGALFLWMLVAGYLTQAAGNGLTAFAYYLVALVFAVVAKMSKYHAECCGESKGLAAKLKLKKR
jgi:hypothetical protein